MVSQIHVIGIRNRVQGPGDRIGKGNYSDDLRRLQNRQRTQQPPVCEAVNSRVHADAYRKRANSDCGKDRVLAQHARAEAKILQHGFQRGSDAHVSYFLLHLFRRFEPHPRCTEGLLTRHPLGYVAVNNGLKVSVHFGIKLGLELLPVKEELI